MRFLKCCIAYNLFLCGTWVRPIPKFANSIMHSGLVKVCDLSNFKLWKAGLYQILRENHFTHLNLCPVSVIDFVATFCSPITYFCTTSSLFVYSIQFSGCYNLPQKTFKSKCWKIFNLYWMCLKCAGCWQSYPFFFNTSQSSKILHINT